MLSIQEVNYFTNIVNKNLANRIQCPLDVLGKGHFTYSRVDDNMEVYFRCTDCDADFRLGIDSEKYIKDAIDKELNQE